jgi:hypothetical protein
MKARSLLILVFILISGFLFCQKLSFTRENVVFNLDSAHLKVSVDLYFKNNTNTAFSQAIFFPFSCEGHIIKVDSVAIRDENLNQYIKPARRNIAGVLYTVNFASQELKKIHITYFQDHDGKLVGFVLTNIKYWNEPLQQASFTLNVNSPSIHIDSTSYKPDKVTENHEKTVYSWYRSNFMPEKELCIHFTTK